ncbi:MAG: TraR/DksA family transcriptional regulator [Bryobacteraceae bacterium]
MKPLVKKIELLRQLRPEPGGPERAGEDDQARVLHDQFVTACLQRIAYEQLKLIEAALARLDSGDYGVCIDCERAIQPRRLAAIPWANRCLECQERVVAQPDGSEGSEWAA